MSASQREYWRLPGLPARQTQDATARQKYGRQACARDVSYWPILLKKSVSNSR